MTVAPAVEDKKRSKKEKKPKEVHPLYNLFYLGYEESPVIDIIDEGDLELKVKYRTLTPVELRDIMEEVELFDSQAAQVITERIETLARSIIHINYMPLVLTKEEQQTFYEKNERQPSPLEMAKIILEDKIKSLPILNLLYDNYTTFSDGVMENIEKAKKKLNK